MPTDPHADDLAQVAGIVERAHTLGLAAVGYTHIHRDPMECDHCVAVQNRLAHLERTDAEGREDRACLLRLLREALDPKLLGRGEIREALRRADGEMHT